MSRLVRVTVALGVLAGLGALLRALFGGAKGPGGESPPAVPSRSDATPRENPSPTGPPASSQTGQSSGSTEASELTRDELYRQAKRLGIEGRSKMNKRELQQALARRAGSS
jgi:hypothetical protein